MSQPRMLLSSSSCIRLEQLSSEKPPHLSLRMAPTHRQPVIHGTIHVQQAAPVAAREQLSWPGCVLVQSVRIPAAPFVFRQHVVGLPGLNQPMDGAVSLWVFLSACPFTMMGPLARG